MIVSDLPAQVAASKADWLPGTTWLGFTPRNGSLNARAQCQSTIQRQFAGGYVLEYITANFGVPNQGFEADNGYLEERDRHARQAGRLIAVHRIMHTARQLPEIIGQDEFEKIQNMWAQEGKRYRWSVAFPIIESYEIDGWPKANEVFDQESYRRLYAHSSSTLRPLNDRERQAIAALPLTPKQASNAWIGVEDEFAFAELSEIPLHIERQIARDLGGKALEGETEERKALFRRRAAWLANRFWQQRARDGLLTCDRCNFDPARVLDGSRYRLRTAMDVHHLNPLEEGRRYTTLSDFALLCPTCHRMEHMALRKGDSLLA